MSILTFHFNFNPILTVPQVLFVSAAAIAVTVGINRTRIIGRTVQARRMRLLVAMRVAVIVCISILLMNPVHQRTDTKTEKPPLLILFDSSHSMSIKDVSGKRRFDAAKSASLEDIELMHRLDQQFECKLFSVGQSATLQGVESFLKSGAPDQDRTHLGEAIESSLAAVTNSASGGVLLISDGRNNGDVDPVRAAALAKSRRFPIFTVSVGDTKQAPDAAIVNHRPQVYAVPDQKLSLTAEVQSSSYSGETAEVDLIRDGKVVQTHPVKLDDKRPVEFSFSISEKSEGTYRYMYSIRPMPGESVVSNNKSAVLVQILKAQSRILVLEGRPTWDARFLIKALRSDPSINVDSIFKITADKIYATQGDNGAAGAVKLPKSATDFAKYDVVVIGKGYEDLFDATGAEALKSYVADHGGNLIFLRGKAEERADTLRVLEPVQWTSEQIENVRMQITADGALNPAFNFRGLSDPQMIVQKLPTMISATRVQGEKALSVVLARASGVQTGSSDKEMAVVAYQNYGQGKVMSLVGEGLWRWALLPPELADYTQCYNDFWTQLVRWMVNQSEFLPGESLSLKAEHATYGGGETVRLIAYTRGKKSAAIPPVLVTGPDGKSTQLILGPMGSGSADFATTFKPAVPGEYVASITRPHGGAIVAPFSVYPDPEEDRITAADPVLMQQIAHAGGGEALELDQLRQLPEKLHSARASLADTNLSRSIWDTGWVLAFLMGLLCTEWIVRRRFGLT